MDNIVENGSQEQLVHSIYLPYSRFYKYQPRSLTTNSNTLWRCAWGFGVLHRPFWSARSCSWTLFFPKTIHIPCYFEWGYQIIKRKDPERSNTTNYDTRTNCDLMCTCLIFLLFVRVRSWISPSPQSNTLGYGWLQGGGVRTWMWPCIVNRPVQQKVLLSIVT